MFITLFRGRLQGRPATLLASIRIGAAVQQNSNNFNRPAGGGAVQRLHTTVVCRDGIDIRTRVNQQLRYLGFIKEGRKCSGVNPSDDWDVALFGSPCNVRTRATSPSDAASKMSSSGLVSRSSLTMSAF